MVRATEIERATREAAIGFTGATGGFDWSVKENKSGLCEVRIQQGGQGPKNCTTIAKKAKWINVPQIIANHINKVLKKG